MGMPKGYEGHTAMVAMAEGTDGREIAALFVRPDVESALMAAEEYACDDGCPDPQELVRRLREKSYYEYEGRQGVVQIYLAPAWTD